MKKLFLSIALIGVLFFIGCGNNGSHSLNSSGSSESNLESGVFSDSPVKNLYYETTSGITGFTDGNGTFKYKKGDFVTFKLGDLTFGTVKASPLVTPFSFSVSDENKIMLIAYLLQNLDVDGNISNGIQLPDNKYISKVSLKDINLSDISSATTKLSLIKTDLIKENNEYNFSDISLTNAESNLFLSMKQNYILYMLNSKKSYILYNDDSSSLFSLFLLENGIVYNEKNEKIGNYQLDTNLSNPVYLLALYLNINNNSFPMDVVQDGNLWILLNDNGNQLAIQCDNKKILELMKFSIDQSFGNISNETFYIMDSKFNKGVITFGTDGNVTIDFGNNKIKGILSNGIIYLEQNNTTISAENSVFDVDDDALLVGKYIIAPDLITLNVVANKFKKALDNNQTIIPTTLQDILEGNSDVGNSYEGNEEEIPVTISYSNQ